MITRSAPTKRRSTRARRVLFAGLSALTALSVLAGPVLANAPLAGATKYAGYDRNEILPYKIVGTFEGWSGAVTTVRNVLETEWDNRAYNASGLPTFSYSSTGAGQVIFSRDAESPCSDINNTSWLACATGWGSSTWKIYIRDFAHSGKTSWAWSEMGNCSGKVCWDLSRSVLHEALHVTLGVGGHDESGETETIMSAVQPDSPDAGWNTNHLQPCDEATGQLLYDMVALNGRYSGCMNQVAETPGNGLTTSLVLDRTSSTVCTSTTVTIKGLLKVANVASYKLLANNPLDDRLVYVYRRLAGATWPTTPHKTIVATNATDFNLAVTLSNGAGGTYEYRFDFPESDTANRLDEGLTAASDIVTIYWRASPCPV